MDQTLSLALISICTALCLGLPPGCDKGLREDVEFSGVSARIRFSLSARHCQLMCTQEPTCHMFAFHQPSQKYKKYFCYMLKSGGTFKSRNHLWIQPSRLPPSRKSNCELKFTMPIPTPNFKVTDNVFSGFSNNLDVDFGSGEDGCLCSSHKYHCGVWVSAQIGLCQTLVCPSQLYPDKQLEDGRYRIKFSAVSAEHCQALCNSHPQCHVFMYFSKYRDARNCHMKSDSGVQSEKNVTENRGVTSGRAQKGCKVEFSWKDQILNGTLYDTKLSVDFKPDVKSCQQSCNDNPNCLEYLYVSMDVSQEYRGNCYLMRDLTLPRPNVRTDKDSVSGFGMNCSV